MPIVHYYLGRPAYVWYAALSRRSPPRATAAGASALASPAALAFPSRPRPTEPMTGLERLAVSLPSSSATSRTTK
jgi:hypothetical protein